MSATENPYDHRLRAVGGQLPTIAVLVVGIAVIAGAIRYLTPVFGVRDSVFLGAACVLAIACAIDARASLVLVVLGVVFGAWLRRVFPAADAGSDVAAVVPFILMLPLALRALYERRARPTVVGGLVIIAATAALAPAAGLPALLNLAAPILAGLYVRSDPPLQALFVRTWLLAASVAFGYGIAQFFHTTAYDAAWLINAQFTSAGVPGEPGFRPFATYSSPGTAAYFAPLTILMAIRPTGNAVTSLPLRVVAVGLSIAFLALSGVRSAWIFGAVALVTALVAGGRRSVSLTVVPLVVGSVFAASQIQALASVFALRADTLNDLASDRSYQARSSLLTSASSYLSLRGQGLGTASNASRTGAAIDNGYIVVLAEGGVIGVLAMAAIVFGVVRGMRAMALPFVVLWLLANIAGYNFGNAFTFVVVCMVDVAAVGAVERPPPEFAASTARSVHDTALSSPPAGRRA